MFKKINSVKGMLSVLFYMKRVDLFYDGPSVSPKELLGKILYYNWGVIFLGMVKNEGYDISATRLIT